METFLLFLIRSTLCLVVFYVVYWLFLRQETFFTMNRLYLLSVLVFSMVLPWVPLSWNTTVAPEPVRMVLEPVMILPQGVEEGMVSHLQWLEAALLIYLTGVVIFGCRFLLQLGQLFRITLKFGIVRRGGRHVVFVNQAYAPFSFFNLVFINNKTMPAASLDAILRHEEAHIRQYHSIDTLLIELIRIIHWFNPVVWLTGREMNILHEFLADEAVLQGGISVSRYQQMILDETMGVQVNGLTNNFNFSLIKKRIAMMTKQKSTGWARTKVLVALPAALLLILLVTARGFTGGITVPEQPANNPTLQLSTDTPATQDSKQKTEMAFVPVPQDKVYEKLEDMPTYPGGDEARIAFLVSNIKYPEEALKKGVSGKVFVQFVVKKDGSISQVKILRGIGSGCDEEAARVVKLMPKWNPGTLNGKPVDVFFTLPIKFALEKKNEGKK